MSELQPGIIGILVVTIGMGLVTFFVVTTTAFVKVSVVIFLIRNAMGLQQVPPNIVLYGIALVLSIYIAAPVVQQVQQQLLLPDQQYVTVNDWLAAGERAKQPVAAFLEKHTSPEQREFFLSATQRVWPETMRQSATITDLAILVPSFMVSELRKAFEIGFLLYLPFVVIDLVVTAILIAMGMSMISPQMITVPFKLFLFVAIEGWSRLIHGLVLTYA